MFPEIDLNVAYSRAGHWNGSHFERAWFVNVDAGVVLGLGNGSMEGRSGFLK
jgi:hypothetical protein